ncbi:phage portal protein [Mycobacteroides abscessus subsp. abscessus]|uniref:phage portal protein n=1 Tax=Mycobacteroides abscessus TaxID=36809 RepID=UPI0039EF34AB
MPQAFLTQAVDVQMVLASVLDQPVEQLWREQPHLRTVVGFVARNVAQVGLQAFSREDDDGRRRLRDEPLARVLDEPNGEDAQYDLIYATIAALCLYDIAYWYVAQDVSASSGWVIRNIPTRWVIGTTGTTAFGVKGYRVMIPNTAASSGGWLEIPAEDMLVFKGWHPTDTKLGTSPVASLKSTLAEQIHAQVFRDQVWRRGGRVGNYIYRPADAPNWPEDVRDRWVAQYRDSYSGDNAPKAGGEPLLEDGMELRQARFSAKDEQFIEASKLSLETCAQVYYINPTMIGVLDNANYANVREFRRALYGETLGPPITQLTQRINRFLVPRLDASRRQYVEFNLQAKLAGSFEEQAQVLQTSVGGPWMTRNEARAKQNMPAIEGGDQLIQPLNVTTNGDQNPVPAETAARDTPADPSEETKNGHSHRYHGHQLHVTV